MLNFPSSFCSPKDGTVFCDVALLLLYSQGYKVEEMEILLQLYQQGMILSEWDPWESCVFVPLKLLHSFL